MAADPFKDTPTAVPSYSREDWETILALLPESERKDPVSYDQFVEKVRKMEAEAKRRGAITERVEIRPGELKAWCEKQNLKICRESISAYGMWIVGGRVLERRKKQ